MAGKFHLNKNDDTLKFSVLYNTQKTPNVLHFIC